MLLWSPAAVAAPAASAPQPAIPAGSLTVQVPLTVGANASKCGIEPWLHLLEALAWPLVIAFLAWRFREPLIELARGLGGRVSKVSLFNVGVEFTTAQPSEQSPLLDEIRDPARSAAIADSAAALVDQVKSTEPADYALIDLGSGKEWLTTRLYIAALMMQRMRGISVFVFVNRTATSERRFLAAVDVHLLRWSLARRYPWLESAFANAYAALFQFNPPLVTTTPSTISETGALQPHQAQQLVQEFINRLQEHRPVPPGGTDERHWVTLDGGLGERADWVTVPLLNEVLPTTVFAAKVEDLADQPRTKRMRAVLRAHAPFVAVVDGDGQFLRLLDRRAYLEKLATTLGDEPE
ncbi:MAG TPA: hypothetical protein VH331_03990 [Allosphingosinicella sp.]|jgi:hypothetical protein|nr:hypothetical protein [Allosphingosinicella sp.]